MDSVPDLAQVDRLLDELQANLKEARLSLKRQEEALSTLKLASRQSTLAKPLYSRQSIDVLSTYGLRRDRSPAAKEALRCLANVLLLNEPSRESFTNLGCAVLAADRLKECDTDEEFLYARMLFLLTYSSNVELVDLVQRHDLASTISIVLSSHATNAHQQRTIAALDSMALCEILRLMFNIQHFKVQLQSHFTGTLPSLTIILLSLEWLTPVLQGLLPCVINALLSLDLKSAVHIDTTVDYTGVVTSLVDILDRATKEHTEADLETGAAPLCTLLRRIYEIADPASRSTMKRLLLPTKKDREVPLGQGDSFSARLLRLTTSANVPTLRSNISALLFEVSDSDPELYVRNVGYGHASGFLMSNNIPVPVEEQDAEATSTHDTNPVTGQLSSAEDDSDPIPEMTEEEKEREAERLFVLFERLKATGVVDVKNPVEQLRESE